jgi:hypothetical protein
MIFFLVSTITLIEVYLLHFEENIIIKVKLYKLIQVETILYELCSLNKQA